MLSLKDLRQNLGMVFPNICHFNGDRYLRLRRCGYSCFCLSRISLYFTNWFAFSANGSSFCSYAFSLLSPRRGGRVACAREIRESGAHARNRGRVCKVYWCSSGRTPSLSVRMLWNVPPYLRLPFVTGLPTHSLLPSLPVWSHATLLLLVDSRE